MVRTPLRCSATIIALASRLTLVLAVPWRSTLVLEGTGALASLENQGAPCWSRCDTGPCEFCGGSGACCKKGVVHAACDAATAELSSWRHTCVAAAELPPDPIPRGRVVAALYALVVAAGVLGTTGVLCLLLAARDFGAAMQKHMKSFQIVSMEEIVHASMEEHKKKGDVVGTIIMAILGPVMASLVVALLLPFQICLYAVSLPVLIPTTLCEVLFSSATNAIAVSVFLGLHAAAFSQVPWWGTAMAYASLPSCTLLLFTAGRLSF